MPQVQLQDPELDATDPHTRLRQLVAALTGWLDGSVAVQSSTLIKESAVMLSEYAALLEAQPALPPCIGNDPLCPCQDGDACHYKDTPKTKAFAVPAQPALLCGGDNCLGRKLDGATNWATEASRDAAVAAERERCAKLCDGVAEFYQKHDGVKYPELRTDAQTGADECAYAIRGG